MVNRFSPGCECCQDCREFRDRVDRIDAATPGDFWTVVRGGWGVAAGRLQLTTPAAGRGRLDVADNYAAVPRFAEVTLRSTQPGDRLGVHLFNEAISCLLTLSDDHQGGELQLGSLVATGLEARPNEDQRLRVCVDRSGPGGQRVTVFLNGVRHLGVAVAAQLPGGQQHGLLAEEITGVPTFDEFTLGRLYDQTAPGCPVCADCPWPAAGVDELRLTITEPDEPCSGFDLRGVYFLQRVAPDLEAVNLTGNLCRQFEIGPPLPSSLDRLVVTVEEIVTADPTLDGTLIVLHLMEGSTTLCRAVRQFANLDLSQPISLQTVSGHYPLSITVEPA